MALEIEVRACVYKGSTALRKGIQDMEKEIVGEGNCVKCSHGTCCEYGRRLTVDGFEQGVK